MMVKDCSKIDHSDLSANPSSQIIILDTFNKEVSSDCSVSQFYLDQKNNNTVEIIVAVRDADNVWSPLQSNSQRKGLGTFALLLESAVCLSIGIMACIVCVHVGRMCFSLPLLCFCSAVMSRHGLSPFSSQPLQHNEFVVYMCISSSENPSIPSGYR